MKMLALASIALAITGMNAQTSTPSTSPTTPAPIDPATVAMETCVTGADIVGPTMSLSRHDASEYMEISFSGDDTLWFAFGFGNKFMAGTYAVISVSNTETQERILGDKDYDDDGNVIAATAMGSLVSTNSWISSPTIEVEDGTRTVTFRRPYNHADTYDFTAFMSASSKSLDVISARGMTNSAGTFAMHNIQNPDAPTQKERDGASIGTVCDYDDGSTPSPVTPGSSTSGANGRNYVCVFGIVVACIVGILM